MEFDAWFAKTYPKIAADPQLRSPNEVWLYEVSRKAYEAGYDAGYDVALKDCES